jgi:nitrous oxidase accessory protein
VRIEETLFGVVLHECRRCAIERVSVQGWGDDAELRGDGIKLWESNDSVVRGARVDRSRDVVVWYTRRAVLEDNVVTGGRYGTHFMYAHDCVVRRSRFERDVVGVFVMYSMRLRVEANVLAGARGAAGVGLGFKDSDAVQATRNWIVANTTGIYLDNTPRTPAETVEIGDNLLALNDLGLRLHSPESGLVVRGNDLHQNAAVVEADGGGDALSADVRNNRFSDYEGYDLDGDGKGDVAYEVKALSSELADARPAVKLFSGTAAMGIVDAVARGVPVLSAKTLLVDAAPLADRPNLPQPRTP